MRVEKGHAAGNELTGHTTARNLGMGRIVSKKKDCIGNTLSKRTELNRSDGLVLVGFVPTDIEARLNAGAHFVLKGQEPNTYNDQGWMSSVAFSPTLNHFIGLGFIKSGHERLGEMVIAADLLRGESIEVKIVSPHFVDPEGERLRA
jgi:sarcosine oxidase subunit alpha